MLCIDINCDMGESYGNFHVGNDSAVIPYVTSINIACGFHGGDPCTIKRTVELAAKHSVNIGAHPSYPDLLGFGRREIKLTPDELECYILYQVGALKLIAETCGKKIHHVKPHGALYNVLAFDKDLAEAFVNAVYQIDPNCLIYHLGSLKVSAIGEQAQNKGLKIIKEFNADTDYSDDGRVVIKKVHGKVNVQDSVERVIQFLQTGIVKTDTGNILKFTADSICVHGDNPSAVEVLTMLRQRLNQINYDIIAPK